MASLMCLPVVVCNLGSEMLYILEQRLRAQSINSEKSVKVLHDVVTSMFDPTFAAELFKPQEVYSQQSTRQIFDKLAHSSIMRLSESSMDKLYDLMTMGFKYQLVNCRSPQEVLTVTLTHLVTIKSYLTDPNVISLVDDFETQLRSHFSRFTPGEWYALRQTLFRFLTDRKVKVSLFLQEGIQHSDGRIKLPGNRPGEQRVGPVGTILRYDGGGDKTGTIAVAYGVKSIPPHLVPLGGNMYAKDRQAPPPAPLQHVSRGDGFGGAVAPSEGGAAGTVTATTSSKGNADELMAKANKDAASELNVLAGLIRPAAPVDTFKLNLFGGEGSAPTSGGGGSGGTPLKGASSAAYVIQFDGDSGNKDLADIMGSFSVTDKKAGAGGTEEEEDDLLTLMDGA